MEIWRKKWRLILTIVLIPYITGGANLPLRAILKPSVERSYCFDVNIPEASLLFNTSLKYTSIDTAKYLTSQSMLETRYGKSILTKQLNNWFGIKGKGKYYMTTEYINGMKVRIPQQFKYYPNLDSCIVDRLRIIRVLKDKGYATDPKYKEKIEKVSTNLKYLYKEETNNITTKQIEL